MRTCGHVANWNFCTSNVADYTLEHTTRTLMYCGRVFAFCLKCHLHLTMAIKSRHGIDVKLMKTNRMTTTAPTDQRSDRIVAICFAFE